MIHVVIINWYRIVAKNFEESEEALTGAIVCLTVTICIAYIYVLYIEPKIAKSLKRYVYG